MSQHWDEFSKSLAESVPRRESLRRLGAVLAGAVLSPLGMEAAWAGRRVSDPCKDFCRCRSKSDKDQCLAACRDCQDYGGRLCGDCGNYYCADFEGDVSNCGACRHVCRPGPWEYAACLFGECWYACAEGAADCGGGCTSLAQDPDNCGACGNVCNGSTPYCKQGRCSPCGPGRADCDGDGFCETNTDFDPLNCGGCGVYCSITPSETCAAGVCIPSEPCWDCGY